MEQTVLLLLVLGLVTIAECGSLRKKRATQLSLKTERREVCIKGLGCYPGGSTEVDDTWVGPELGNFIAQLVDKTGVQVGDIHIIGHRLDVHVTGKKTGSPQPEEKDVVPLEVKEIVPPEEDKIVLKPMDCQEVMEAGHHETGVYEVQPKGGATNGRPVRVRCDMDTDGGGWTVIQRRGNFSEQENFDRNWQDYKNGFGDPSRDYWIGNDNIYALSNQGAYSARFDMMDAAGNKAYELYGEFRIEDENSNYRLHISNPSGTAGDSMRTSSEAYYSNNGRMFSTKDVRNDDLLRADSCAVLRKSGFWWNKCSNCNPNGVYRPGNKNDPSVMHYYDWKPESEGLYAMEIKLKRL